MVKNNLRSVHIGCALPGFDVASHCYARKGGIKAHDYCVAYRNVGAADLLIAIVDGRTGQPKSDDTFERLEIGLITPLATKEILPHGGWLEFNLDTTPTTATAANSGTGNKITTVTMTGNATTYYVVEVLSDVACTLAFPGATTPIQLIGNPGLLVAGAVPAGRNAFLVYNTAAEARTFTMTNAEADAVTGIVTADVKVHAVVPWTVRQLWAMM